MNNDAAKFPGKPLTSVLSASIPPADPPMTIIFFFTDSEYFIFSRKIV
jgi:hypothetical protein